MLMTKIRDKNKQLLTILLLILTLASVFVAYCPAVSAESSNHLSKLAIVMYHNTVPDKLSPSKYVITESELRTDFDFLKNNGYNVLSLEKVLYMVENNISLPEKSVLLTFDDGYIYNMDIVIPLLQEYSYTAVFAVVGEFTALNKSRSDLSKAYTYLDYDDIKACSDSGVVEIAYHSYFLHHCNKTDKGVVIRSGESNDDYIKRFRADTDMLSLKLKEQGIQPSCYVYPYGLFCKQSESVLDDLDIPFSLTCSEGINTIKSKKSLRLMKRINRIGDIENYLEKELNKYGY